jgi:hypothetical protein
MAKILGNPQSLFPPATAIAFLKDWLFKAWYAITQGVVLSAGSQTIGTSTLVAGSVLIYTPKVSSTCQIFLTPINSVNAGVLYENVAARVPGSHFQVSSNSSTDGSAFNWLLIDVVSSAGGVSGG